MLSLAQIFWVVCEGNLCDPIDRHIWTHCYLMNLIGWSFCDVLGIGLFRSAEVGQKSCFERVVLDAPYLGQFVSDFVRVKNNVSPRPSTFIYPIFEKCDFWPNYPFKTHCQNHHPRQTKWKSNCESRIIPRDTHNEVLLPQNPFLRAVKQKDLRESGLPGNATGENYGLGSPAPGMPRVKIMG